MAFHGLMIVRDEGDVLAQVMEHLLTWIDHLYVWDLGSTDNTWEIVEQFAAKDKRVVPFLYRPTIYSDSIRSYMFHKLRDRFKQGDWIIKVDGDEFYEINPPDFIRDRLRPIDSALYLQWYYFRLTNRDVAAWERGEETLADRARPIQDRRRFYNIVEYTEPRLFKYRRNMQWLQNVYWPYNTGFVAKERIPLRHYPHRDPAQMQSRYDLRFEMMGLKAAAGGHWNLKDWRSDVIDMDAPKAQPAEGEATGVRTMAGIRDDDLRELKPGEKLPEVRLTGHIARGVKRFAQRMVYSGLTWFLDRRRPKFDPNFEFPPIPPEIQQRLKDKRNAK
jgi:hypothetical protein